MAPATNRDDPRRLDLVVFGATSFVGRILCRYLVDRGLGAESSLRWAIAGRDAQRLAEVTTEIGAEVEQIVADALVPADMARLVASTRVVVSTVGPYARYGSPLVEAAANAGTDYCDLAGEPQWMRRMIDTHGAAAHASGARIVPACGFDSIPSDLGVHVAQREAIARFGQPCVRIAMRVAGAKGGASGGTVASLMNVIEESSKDRELRTILANPYALAPPEHRSGVKQPEVTVPSVDDVSGQWVAPFVMGAINTKVVHRSHGLLGRPWGDDFCYDEAMLMGKGPLGAVKAAGLAGGMVGFMGLAALGPTRSVLNRFVLPSPGEGPSDEVQLAGFFDLRFYGTTAGGDSIEVQVTGDRDPGYGSTAKMLGEAALCLVEGLGPDPAPEAELPRGFLTPSTAFGDALVDRLQSHAGVEFTIVE